MDPKNLFYGALIAIGLTLALIFGLRVDKTPNPNEGVDFNKAVEMMDQSNTEQATDSQETTGSTKAQGSLMTIDAPDAIEPQVESQSTLSQRVAPQLTESSSAPKVALSKTPKSEKLNEELANNLINKAVQLSSEGDLLSARNLLLNAIETEMVPDLFPKLYDLLGDLNLRLFFSEQVVANETQIYKVKSGDTVSDIANDHHITLELLLEMNHLDSSMIYKDQILKVPMGRFSVKVWKARNFLVLFYQNQFFKYFRIGTGKDNSTPVGIFKIKTKQSEPVWYRKGKIIPFGDPDNLLGTRWLGFDLKGYGIHGTWDPSSIGQQSSEGCVRLLNEDVERIFIFMPLNAIVEIVE